MSGTATVWASAISLSTGRIGQTGRMPTTTIAERRPGRAPASRPDRSTSPALEPRTTGPAHALASRLGGWHPAIVFVVALVLGYIALAAFAIALGMLLVHVILPSLGIGSLDERFPAWLSHHRDHALTAGAYSELDRLLDRVDGIAAGVNQCDDLCFRGLRLQQK